MFRIWTSGQTGCEQACWRAAKDADLPTAGFMPAHYRTNDGDRPEFAELYGAREMPVWSQVAIDRANISNADLVIGISPPESRRVEDAIINAIDIRRPVFTIVPVRGPGGEIRFGTPAYRLAEWLVRHDMRPVVNVLVVGCTEFQVPGVGAAVEAYLGEVFGMIGSPLCA